MTVAQHAFSATSTRPVWLLDFDDVLNAVTRNPDRSVWPDWQATTAPAHAVDSTTVQHWPIWYSPTVIQVVADAHTAGVEVVWLSTWERQTAVLPAAIPGLPVLPFLVRPASEQHREATSRQTAAAWWKFDLARTLVPDTRPLLWTDDDLRFEPDAQVWARSRPAATLALAPTVRLGLTPRQVRSVREFLGLFVDLPGGAAAGRM